MGELKPENIKEVLKCRDRAAKTPCGKAAAILAKLDYQYYEKSIDESHIKLRLELLAALKKKNEVEIKRLLKQYGSYPQHDHHIYHYGTSLHRAYNLITNKKPIVAKSLSEDAWSHLREMISASFYAQNHTALQSVFVHIDRQIYVKEERIVSHVL